MPRCAGRLWCLDAGCALIGRSGRARRVLAALALVAAVGIVMVAVLSAGSPAASRGATDPSTAAGAATVQRRDLVQTDTESGTLSYSDPQTVYNRLSGTITWLPSVGQVIKPGGTLYRVDGEPVILMNGTTPAYRTLTAGIGDGSDILALNRNLVALGFNPDGIVVNDIWQPATTAGVELFQESLGEVRDGQPAARAGGVPPRRSAGRDGRRHARRRGQRERLPRPARRARSRSRRAPEFVSLESGSAQHDEHDEHDELDSATSTTTRPPPHPTSPTTTTAPPAPGSPGPRPRRHHRRPAQPRRHWRP